MLFRVIIGLAVGAASAVVPIYLAEISPANHRGSVVTCNQFMVVSGQLTAYVTNAILGNVYAHEVVIWRVMFAVFIISAILLFAGMLIVPESPRYRKDATVQRDPALRTLLLTAAAIGIVQQATGVNALMYYGTQILREAGFSTDAALTANISNGVLSVIGAGVGLWFLGKYSSRTVLTIGLSGTTLLTGRQLPIPRRRSPPLGNPAHFHHLSGLSAGRRLTGHLGAHERALPGLRITFTRLRVPGTAGKEI